MLADGAVDQVRLRPSGDQHCNKQVDACLQVSRAWAGLITGEKAHDHARLMLGGILRQSPAMADAPTQEKDSRYRA